MGRCRLRDDHEDIRALLARIEAGNAPSSELRSVLEPHLAFEEAEVLPRLAQHLPTGTGPIRTILEDHQSIRALLDGLVVDPTILERLASLLRAHFQKEEELLLPFAHAHLDLEDMEQIGCSPTASPHGATP